jgi:molybdenum cofactor synthesis domain-containing protein
VASIGESAITSSRRHPRRRNRRFAGEDLMAGSAALRKGKIIRPADLGLLASLGIAEVPVQRRLRVAFFSTGDELRSIGEALDAGCVYDSNRYTLYGMLTRLGCDIIDMGVVRDDPQALEEALRSACENADAIVTSGGVSVGAADYTREIMAAGRRHVLKIGMRPGARSPSAILERPSALRPARQSGGGDGVVLLLRARRAAAHDGRRGAVAAAAREVGRRDPQEARPHRVPARHPVG